MTKTLTLRSFDIPQLHKFGIGFDSLFDDLQRFATQSTTNYPPHNVIKTGENAVLIEVAVAGFAEGESGAGSEGINMNCPQNIDWKAYALGEMNEADKRANLVSFDQHLVIVADHPWMPTATPRRLGLEHDAEILVVLHLEFVGF